jgi:ABC-type cobalamin/Fe3+-siderophores transport system ATPase subunit
MKPNPFSTTRTKPGKIPFIFADRESLEQLLAEIERGQRMQIVGAHGTGKSTLLTELITELQRAGYVVDHQVLRDGQRNLSLKPATVGCSAKSVVVIDGFEQLSRWSRWRLRRHVKRIKSKLVVTSHVDVGFTTLHETKVDQKIVRCVVRSLVGDRHEYTSRELVNLLMADHGQNLREILFELYDIWQSSEKAD